MTTRFTNHPSGKWMTLALFWLIYFFNHADRQVLFSVFPLLKHDLGLGDAQLGLLGSCFQWVFALLVPVAGALSDSVRRKNLIAAALLAWSASTFASGVVTGFALLLVLRSFTGAGEAFYYPAATSIIGDLHGPRTRAFALSIHQTSLYFGIIVSGTLAGYIGEHYGWRGAFLAFGGAGVLLALVVMKFLHEPVRGQMDGPKPGDVAQSGQKVALGARIAMFFHAPTPVVLMFCFCSMTFSSVAVVTWMPTLLYRQFGYSLTYAAFHATFYHQLGAFVGVLAGGWLGDRWAIRSRAARPWLQTAGLLGSVPFIFWLGHSNSSSFVFLALGLFGVFRGMYDSNLFASLFEVITPAARATATGLMLSAGFLVGGSSPLIIGSLSQTVGLGPALAATSACYLLAGLALAATTLRWFDKDARRINL